MKQPDAFFQGVQEAYDKATAILDERSKEYNNSIDVRLYWVFGMDSIFDKLWGKLLRMKSMLSTTERHRPVRKEMRDRYLDSCIDLMNYAAFMYAEQRCLEMDTNTWNAELTLRRLLHATPASTITPRTRESISNPVERVVLDEGAKPGDQMVLPFTDDPVRDEVRLRAQMDGVTGIREVCPHPTLSGGPCKACLENDEGARTDPGANNPGVGTGGHSKGLPGTDSEDT